MAQQPEQSEQQDAQTPVEITAISRHHEYTRRSTARLRNAVAKRLRPRMAHDGRADRKQHGCDQQQPGNEDTERAVVGHQQQRRTGCAPCDAESGQTRQRQARRRLQISAKAPGASHVSRKQRERAGGIGQHRRQSGEDKRWQGQEAAATGDGVECACTKRRSQQQCEVERVGHVVEAGRSTVMRSTRDSQRRGTVHCLLHRAPHNSPWSLVLKTVTGFQLCRPQKGIRIEPFAGIKARAQKQNADDDG